MVIWVDICFNFYLTLRVGEGRGGELADLL